MNDTDIEMVEGQYAAAGGSLPGAPEIPEGDAFHRFLYGKFRDFQRGEGYPVDKEGNYVCAFFKFYPEKFRWVENLACTGRGFKNISYLHNHYVRDHLPLEKLSKAPKHDCPRMSMKQYEIWNQGRKSYEGRGEKGAREKKWWMSTRDILGVTIPDPLPEEFHKAFPGAESEVALRFARHLCHDFNFILNAQNILLQSSSNSDTHSDNTALTEIPVYIPTPQFSERPDATESVYRRHPKATDSGYGTGLTNETADGEDESGSGNVMQMPTLLNGHGSSIGNVLFGVTGNVVPERSRPADLDVEMDEEEKGPVKHQNTTRRDRYI